ncbi:MAG: tyrosine--tRNA ligase, partial [Phycisphaerae bacterium]
TDIPEVVLSSSLLTDGALPAFRLLTALELCASGSEARRLIAQGGAKIGAVKETISDADQKIVVVDGLLVWAGRKKFCRVRLS